MTKWKPVRARCRCTDASGKLVDDKRCKDKKIPTSCTWAVLPDMHAAKIAKHVTKKFTYAIKHPKKFKAK